MLKELNNVLQDFISLFFPEYCFACQESLAKGENIICTACRIKLPYTNVHLLNKADNLLLHRFFGKVPVKQALAYLYFRRSGRVQHLLHALKYKGVQEIGELLGNWYGKQLRENAFNTELDLILPVPLHRIKKQKRGYNQADSFARGLSNALEVPWQDQVLIRQKNTGSQTNKSRPERWANVAEVFKVAKPDRVLGQRILIVDDVLTTGATVEACALKLLQAGAKEVSIATIAAA